MKVTDVQIGVAAQAAHKWEEGNGYADHTVEDCPQFEQYIGATRAAFEAVLEDDETMKLKRWHVQAKDVNGNAVMSWFTFTRWEANKIKKLYGSDIYEPIPGKPLYTIEINKI